jgi:hypothetical protein
MTKNEMLEFAKQAGMRLDKHAYRSNPRKGTT